MAFVLALMAATTFALGSVLQQKGTLETPAEGDDPRFLVQLLRRPVWLAGGGLQAAGWVLQAAALDRGSLLVVQSVTTLSLVIALPFGEHITGQQIGHRVMIGAIAMLAGIFLFLSVGAPEGGTSQPDAAAWWSAGISSTVIVAALTVMGRRRQGATRALFFGSGAGIAFALQAAVTKVFVGQFGHGIGSLITSWTVYALVATALIGFALQQSALKTNVLAPAMASSNAVTLFASVVLATALFDETLSHGNNRLAPAVVGLGVALAGLVLLSEAQPPSPADSRVTATP